MSDNLLEIRDLHVIYDTDEATVYALNGINLDLKKGRTLGLVGETGAGKTTLAFSVLKLLPSKVGKIVKGSIVFDGSNLISATNKEMQKIRGNRISMIFQDPMTALNPVKTVGEQIAESFYLHDKTLGKKEVQKKVDELLTMVGIDPARKTDYPHQFSGGMKQRVVIAIALALEPDLLLADEPTTALDVTIQAQILELMRKLKRKRDKSVVMITHDLGIIAQICDDVAVMYAGEIIEYGTVQDIFNNESHHPYTVGLFNSIPDIDKDVSRLSPIPGLMPDPTELPTGCKFHPRCPHCRPKCKTDRPGHWCSGTQMIQCHLAADIPKFTLQERKDE